MSVLPSVNLPPLILFHALFLSLAGLRMIFRQSSKLNREVEASAMAGITTLGIGVAYLTTSYMPIAENQFLHASIPVRMFLALVASLRLLSINNISKAGRNEMLFVIVYDGVGAIISGWQLDNFSGRVPGQ